MKPILFNTDMVKAILEGRKTVTRRTAFQCKDLHEFPRPNNLFAWWYRGREYRSFDDALIDCKSKCKYRKGDVLYVRETWGLYHQEPNFYVYKADSTPGDEFDRDLSWRWRPSIHMPKEAARIFLRVTSIDLERLQEPFFALDCRPIVELRNEGIDIGDQCRECLQTYGAPCCIDEESECGVLDDVRGEFSDLLDSTANPTDFERFGWSANPWVWVICFERCEKPEAS